MTLSLAEFESRCLGTSPGEITPADVVQAVNMVSQLGDAYRQRLFEKAEKWKPEKRFRRKSQRVSGIERSLPRGDQQL